jgi:hypothetical protein
MSTRKASQSGKQVEGVEELSAEEFDAGDEEGGQNAAGDETSQGKGDKKGQEGKDGRQGGDGNNSSLLAKFREAMQNLMSRMKQPPAGSGAGQQQASGKNQNAKQQAGKGQSGQQGRQGGQQSEGQEGQESADSMASESAAARGAGESGEENASKEPGSGIGKQDGSKDVKLAEQLAAMGKISEIIGKRSANVSGEVTVEVQKSHQQLSTPYSRRDSAHGETSTEISRDEVPVALQAYVQQYFEQVRRQAPEGVSRGAEAAEPRP